MLIAQMGFGSSVSENEAGLDEIRTIAELFSDIMQDFIVTESESAYKTNLSIKNTSIVFTVIQFLNSLRLREAERLLQSDELSVTSIAARSGFHSVQYFSKHFKWDVGLTPTAYREKSAQLRQKR